MKRVNISIDEQTLGFLDAGAESAGMNRSEYISRMAEQMRWVMDYSDKLAAEIDAEPDYDRRQAMKTDSFYLLRGFISAFPA